MRAFLPLGSGIQSTDHVLCRDRVPKVRWIDDPTTYITPMEVPGFRPRYRFVTPLSAAEIKRSIREQLNTKNPRGLLLRSTDQHLVLSYPQRGSAAWTPQMDLTFEAVANDHTLVRCLIGPIPTIWMLFAGGYLALTLLALTGLTLGFAQHLAGSSPWGYPLAGIAAAALLTMIIVERSGRRRARPDMYYLGSFVDESLGCDCLKLAREQAE